MCGSALNLFFVVVHQEDSPEPENAGIGKLSNLRPNVSVEAEPKNRTPDGDIGAHIVHPVASRAKVRQIDPVRGEREGKYGSTPIFLNRAGL
jgi:hypothetical protein